ncbi:MULTISPECIES: CDP-alcohol phosphatidyltransferase family protein [Actinosynnema]|uniref:CDP-alcohol phosphatidyltransferase family protein n=1 Tax=Actinosynnema TaxID=40566 RepID=UPI0020A2A0F9|nr:CDP-alcohol phosphatidyltransferase family protein [Actinosynnema pretiosum]MCP2098329.1 CDP-diacylglycerol--glycerol-3-phosphate 3-phosphatidyltransferase [Actinosynnema pretiosum]
MSTPPAAEPAPQDRYLTIPNALSVLRLLGVPVFLYLLLGPRADGWALALLIAAGVSDWLDGKIARWLDQTSKLGVLLDPAADRLYILATMIAFVVRDILPLWVVLLLAGRELVVGACLPVLRRLGYRPAFTITYLGKAATFILLYAFPMLLAAQGGSTFAQVVRPFAYAMMIWGAVFYLWSGALYAYQLVLASRAQRPGVVST